MASDRRRWFGLAMLSLGVALIIMDATIVNVAIPSIIRDLGIQLVDAEWITTIYSLVFAALLITVGRIGDQYGRKHLFHAGLAIFMLASLLAGRAPSGIALVGARSLQGVGAAMILPSTLSIVNATFRGRDRAIAFGVWGSVIGGMAAIGPLVGGWLTTDFSWRWAFYINIPLGIISLIMVWKVIGESRGEDRRRLDLAGVLMSSLGLGLIVFGLIEGQALGWLWLITTWDLGPISLTPGDLSPVPMALGFGAFLLLLFVVTQSARAKQGKSVLMDLSLFRIRRYGYGNVVATLVSLGEFGVLFALPLWLQAVQSFSPLQTGALVAILGVGAVLAGGAARHVSAMIGATRLVRLGMVLEIIGITGVLLLLSVDRSAWWLALPLFVYGVGVGFDTAQLTNVILEDVPPQRSGGASSVTSTLRQVGSTLGSAVLGTVLFVSLGLALQNDLAVNQPDLSQDQRTQIVDQVVDSSGEAIIPLEQQQGMADIAQEAKESYTRAVKIMAGVAGGAMVIGLIASFGLPADRRREEDDEEKSEPVKA